MQKPRWFPGAKQPRVCITVALCLAPIYMVCVCISLLLFTFSFVENTENHSETPATPAPPPPALPKPKPKPKPKKTPVPPKGAAAGASIPGQSPQPTAWQEVLLHLTPLFVTHLLLHPAATYRLSPQSVVPPPGRACSFFQMWFGRFFLCEASCSSPCAPLPA